VQFHLETKEMPIYALTVDPAGAKLTRHDAANGGEPWIEQAGTALFHAKWTATSANMDIFAGRLARILDRPVIDQTGIKGDCDFTLVYCRDPLRCKLRRPTSHRGFCGPHLKTDNSRVINRG
jgi:uncharacterized protein (TIGR03435 family)